LSALGAAARVEESIKQTEWVNFDLRELESAVAAYRDGFPQARIALVTPPTLASSAARPSSSFSCSTSS
jgi:hypothetical protein